MYTYIYTMILILVFHLQHKDLRTFQYNIRLTAAKLSIPFHSSAEQVLTNRTLSFDDFISCS